MDAKELIEHYKTELKDIELCKQSYVEGRSCVIRNIEDIDRYVDIIRTTFSALSRSRIRDTATEPPTREDGGTGEHAPYVMARENKHDFWEEIELEWVANHPDEYPHWTCAPQLPEVE